MSSNPAYSIADVKSLLSQRVGLDLSPIELAEILWLALQQGVVVPEDSEGRRPPSTHELEPEPEAEPEAPETLAANTSSSHTESIPVVAEPPRTGVPEEQEDLDQTVEPALPINIPETVALRNRQAIARSLRPLMRKVASKQRRVLDEEATVIQVAETQTWSPVVKPEPERWLELAIVIEVTNLLDVWQDTIAEFQQLMERHGAFRNVRTWQLKPNAEGEPELFLQTASGLRGSPRSPRELLDASGRRQILLLSDCTSRAWRSGKIPKLLELWSRENPVAIVQLLPEHYWDRSALKASYPVALGSRRPGALSRDWAIEGLSPRQRQHLPEGLKLPIVTIQPESLGQWAEALAATHDQQTTGILFNPRDFQAPPATAQASPLTAKQLVQRFRNTASEKAQELADMIAVLPVNWSVIRLVQKNLLQDEPWQQTGALYLAEIFLSGLLRSVSTGSKASSKHQKTAQYDFVEGVRDVLLGTIPISEAQTVGEEVAAAVFKQLPMDVQERVNADIERRYGDALSYFEAFLIPDLPWGDAAAAEIFPFAQVTHQVLQRWGGAFAELAAELGREDSSLTRETTAYAALEQQLDYFQHEILNAFVQQEHQFELSFPDLRPKELLNQPVAEEMVLVEGGEISVVILDRKLTENSEDSITFELAVRINFAVEISYPDFDEYVPALDLFPTYEVTVPNQTVDGVAEVVLSFLGEGEVEPELVELRVNHPILINPTRTQVPSFQIPPLQTFKFEVATIFLEHLPAPTTDFFLEIFDFETVSISLVCSEELEWEEALGIVDQAMRVETRKSLTDLQQEIIQAVWERCSYDEVANTNGYSVSHVRRVAAAMFRDLSNQMERSISRKTLRAALIQFAAPSDKAEVSLLREHRQAYQFIERLENDVALEMVLVPGGSFMMGSLKDELDRFDHESPQHFVPVPSFLMSKYAITQQQWQVVTALPQVKRPLEADPSNFKGHNRPVERVPWYDAVEFCDRLSQLTGKSYRLPTEAEWEYACRAGTTTPFHFGETITTDLANYNGNYTYGQGPEGIYRAETIPVGSFPANAFGLHDMHGNVWEWCLDHWHSSYKDAPTDGSAWIDQNAEDAAARVLRGGSGGNNPRYCRSAFRNHDNPASRNNDIGFRVVCSASRTL